MYVMTCYYEMRFHECYVYLCYVNMQTSILCVMKCYYEMRHILNYMSLKNMTSYYEMRLHER